MLQTLFQQFFMRVSPSPPRKIYYFALGLTYARETCIELVACQVAFNRLCAEHDAPLQRPTLSISLSPLSRSLAVPLSYSLGCHSD